MENKIEEYMEMEDEFEEMKRQYFSQRESLGPQQKAENRVVNSSSLLVTNVSFSVSSFIVYNTNFSFFSFLTITLGE